MTKRFPKMSPKRLARLTGVFYLVTIVAAIIAQGVIAERLVNSRDASVTAANITAHADLFRFGFTMYMIEMVAQTIMTMLFYQLLKPVSRTGALIAAVIGVVGCGIKALSRLFFVAPAIVLEGSQYLNTFSAQQLHSLALLFYELNEMGAAIAVVFFGFSTLITGWLIIRSTYLPRVLGWFALVGGIGWLSCLWPPLGYRLNLYIAAVGLLGSLATIVWLIAFGVNEERWTVQARAAEASIWR
ncbi:MAG TPA: DUF4386 domain-containing protein [Gemmatimonadaceae bacterium]